MQNQLDSYLEQAAKIRLEIIELRCSQKYKEAKRKEDKHDRVLKNALEILISEIESSKDDKKEYESLCGKYIDICDDMYYISSVEDAYSRLYQLDYKEEKLFINWILMYIEEMDSSEEYFFNFPEYSKKADAVIKKFKHLFTSENQDALYYRGVAKTLPLLVGRSPEMKELHRQIAKRGPTNKTVLIYGETGTGKELVAKCLHYHSHRYQPDKDNENFYAVNCGAFPESDLLNSELFGHVKGVFTGVTQDYRGLFERADGGTLFLDEIGKAHSRVKASLLRVLETGEYESLGSYKTKKCDVRVIAATNTPLKNNERFGEDLYYRLARNTIYIPPLKERKGDIVVLASYFIDEFCREKGLEDFIDMDDNVCHALEQFHWPGNVRELKNVIEEAIIQCEELGVYHDITIEHLPEDVCQLKKTPLGDKLSKISEEIIEVLDSYDETKDLNLSQRVGRLVETFKKTSLKRALKDTGGNVTKAAKLAKLDRSEFHKKAKKYDIEIELFRKRV